MALAVSCWIEVTPSFGATTMMSGALAGDADPRKVAFHLERQVRHQRRIDGEIAGRYQQQGAAVRGGMLDHLNADIAGAPGLVFDTMARPERGPDNPAPATGREYSTRSAWIERHHQGQRPPERHPAPRVGASDPARQKWALQPSRRTRRGESAFVVHSACVCSHLPAVARSHKPNRHCRPHAQPFVARDPRSVRGRFVPLRAPS